MPLMTNARTDMSENSVRPYSEGDGYLEKEDVALPPSRGKGSMKDSSATWEFRNGRATPRLSNCWTLRDTMVSLRSIFTGSFPLAPGSQRRVFLKMKRITGSSLSGPGYKKPFTNLRGDDLEDAIAEWSKQRALCARSREVPHSTCHA